MTKTRKVIGKVSVPRGEFSEGTTYYRYNVVTYLGSAFMCTVDSTTVAPATLQDDGETVVLNTGWIFFADATAARSAGTRVSSLERDLGQYEPLPSVAMTAETTGKYINADGAFVDDADFNIAAIGAVVVGNTYELYMGGSDKMKQGVALFVARIKTTTTSGTERIEYVPLFSAMSTDIAKSGYVCFEAMEAYSDVLVCYRADVPEATTLLVRRYGTKASIATQINNLRKKVDLKSFADGYYESMRVGTADNLTSKGDATEEVIMSRKAGGDNQIEDGSASIKRIKGYSVVGNQLWDTDGKMGKFELNQTQLYNIDINGRSIRITSKGSGVTSNSLVVGTYTWKNNRVGHKYLIVIPVTDNTFAADNPWALCLTKEISSTYTYLRPGLQTKIIEVTKPTQGISINSRFNNKALEEGQTLSVDYVSIIDLTQMFGSGNEPTTPDDFAKRLGYDSIDDVPYIPYNEGEIVSSFAEGIKTTDTEGKVSERKWSETLKKYFPDGLKSAGSAYDEITPTKAVKKIGMVDLGDLIWHNQWWNESNKPSHRIYAQIQTKQKGQANIICDKKYIVRDINNALLNNLEICGSNALNFIYLRNTNYPLTSQGFNDLVASLKGINLVYELATPEETTYDELNLTEQVAEGGTEEAIITEGKTSTPLRADIVYPIDAYNTIKANKANIGTLSSLNTASKTDLVSAINELAGNANAVANDVASLQSGLSTVEAAASTNRADLDRTMSRVASPDDRALPLLCGQPPILFGAGTPRETVVPENWNQYDPATGEGYNWNGKPSAIGQQYVDTTAASGGRYIAARNGEWDLKWINC
nr:MAG TPA: hypothetical protein [Caudoviricetes sp.]